MIKERTESIMTKAYRIMIVTVLIMTMIFSVAGCSSDHAPGYGNTSKCTICGKPATHKTSNYGYCDKHWADATK